MPSHPTTRLQANSGQHQLATSRLTSGNDRMKTISTNPLRLFAPAAFALLTLVLATTPASAQPACRPRATRRANSHHFHAASSRPRRPRERSHRSGQRQTRARRHRLHLDRRPRVGQRQPLLCRHTFQHHSPLDTRQGRQHFPPAQRLQGHGSIRRPRARLQWNDARCARPPHRRRPCPARRLPLRIAEP